MIIWALMGFCLLTNAFWAVVVIRLLNRVMSRDFSEYVQAERLRKVPIKPPHKTAEDETPDIEDQKRADEINRLMGII